MTILCLCTAPMLPGGWLDILGRQYPKFWRDRARAGQVLQQQGGKSPVDSGWMLTHEEGVACACRGRRREWLTEERQGLSNYLDL